MLELIGDRKLSSGFQDLSGEIGAWCPAHVMETEGQKVITKICVELAMWFIFHFKGIFRAEAVDNTLKIDDWQHCAWFECYFAR